MKLYRLHRTQVLPVSLPDAWRFFSSPLNLPSITPPWLNLRIVGRVRERMVPGMLIRYRLTPLPGIAVNWVSEITHVQPPTYFVDEQRFGPYRVWHHQHRFRSVEEGVEMTDEVSYGLRYGLVGTLVHALFVCNRLEAIFDFRQQTLARRFNRHPN